MKSTYKRNLKAQFTRGIAGPVIVKITTEVHGRYGPRVIACIRRSGSLPPVYIARRDPSGSSMSVETLCDRMMRDYEGFVEAMENERDDKPPSKKRFATTHI